MRRIREFLPEAEGGPAAGRPGSTRSAGTSSPRRLPSLKGRAKTLKELVDGAAYLLAEAPACAGRQGGQGARCRTPARCSPSCCRELEAVADWQVPALEAAVRAFGEASGLKLGKVAQPLRAALTGKSVSPPVFDVMAVLGREEALARIRDQAR